MTAEKIQKIIESYLEFECPGTDDIPEKPFVIVAPARTKKGYLRIYAHGGLAAMLSITEDGENEPLSDAYIKYAPDSEQKMPEDVGSLEYQKYAEKVCRCRWLSGKGKKQAVRKERAVQDQLTRKFMYSCSHIGNVLLVTDIEYKIPSTYFGESPEVDFILFDGESFGFVEFKNDGKSMDEGTNNSLSEHMNSFEKLLTMGRCQQKKEYLECCRRLKCLLKFNLVDQSWKESIEKLPDSDDGEFPEKLFWCGFLFVGGKKENIQNEIRKQLEFEKSALDIRYQYSEGFPDKLTMDQSLKDIFAI